MRMMVVMVKTNQATWAQSSLLSPLLSLSVVSSTANATRNAASRKKKTLRVVRELTRPSSRRRLRARTLTRDTPRSPLSHPSRSLKKKLEQISYKLILNLENNLITSNFIS